jgi:hypothetical protein
MAEGGLGQGRANEGAKTAAELAGGGQACQENPTKNMVNEVSRQTAAKAQMKGRQTGEQDGAETASSKSTLVSV